LRCGGQVALRTTLADPRPSDGTTQNRHEIPSPLPESQEDGGRSAFDAALPGVIMVLPLSSEDALRFVIEFTKIGAVRLVIGIDRKFASNAARAAAESALPAASQPYIAIFSSHS
jgi:hypothetical protein